MCCAHEGHKNRFTHFLNAVVMKHLFQFLPVFLAMFFTVPSFGQFQDRSTTSPAADNDYTTDMTRTARVGIGFATNTAFNAALGTANRARLAVRDGIIAHHVSDTIGNFAGKWLGLGIGNPGGPVQPYGLAIADTGSVAFYNVLRENFNGVIRKNTVAGFGGEPMRNAEFALLLVEGVCFRQDIFRQDEQDDTSDPMAASHRIALRIFLN